MDIIYVVPVIQLHDAYACKSARGAVCAMRGRASAHVVLGALRRPHTETQYVKQINHIYHGVASLLLHSTIFWDNITDQWY